MKKWSKFKTSSENQIQKSFLCYISCYVLKLYYQFQHGTLLKINSSTHEEERLDFSFIAIQIKRIILQIQLKLFRANYCLYYTHLNFIVKILNIALLIKLHLTAHDISI